MNKKPNLKSPMDRKKVPATHPKVRNTKPTAKKAIKTKAAGSINNVTKHNQKMGKTPKGKSGGPLSMKDMGTHVPTTGGWGRGKRKKKVTPEHVAAAMHKIR